MASQKTKRYVPPKFWVTCANREAKHPHKFGYPPKDVKSYILRLKEDYRKAGMSFMGVVAMLDHAQKEIEEE